VTTEKKAAGPGGKIAKQLAAVAFGALFLWLAFSKADLGQIWSYAKQANPIYLFLICISAVISHLLRAARWLIMLRPLTEHKISLWNSFCAVIYGYAVNIVVPRGGEVARLVSISKSEALPWAGVLSTMFIDRLLDIAMLCLIFGVSAPLLPAALLAKMPFLTGGGVVLIIGSLALLILLPRMADFILFVLANPRVSSRLNEKIRKTGESLAEQFRIGTKSLTDRTAYPSIAGLTLLIWFFYWLNGYLAILSLHLESQVSLLQSFVVFSVSNAGVLIPSPGSVGSFHFFVSQGLILVAGVDTAEALAYATVLHIFCFVIAVCIPALVCFLVQSSREKKTTELPTAPIESQRN
jgi:glycosyltransferase 2 family protein